MRRLFVPAFLLVISVICALAYAAAAVEAGGGGHGGCTAPRDGTDEPVVIQNSCFTPAVLYVQPGDTVKWQQRDQVPHNVKLFDGEVVGGKDTLYSGDSVSRSFDSPGVYAYYCALHPSMLGVVVAGDPASPGFGANLSLQAGEEQRQTAAADLPGKMDNAEPSGFRWAEAAVGVGLAGGLALGLVAAGGGLGRLRRSR